MTIIGSVGVTMLLLAFLANLVGWLEARSKLYQGLNVAGAGLAAYASYGIGFVPFVVRESTWCAVAIVALFQPRSVVSQQCHGQ